MKSWLLTAERNLWSLFHTMHPFNAYDIPELRADETAALFVVHAAIIPTDTGQMLDWTQELEERLETGGRAWVVARGRRLAGYALVDPVPGLPGVYDLTGGIVPARRRQGWGGRLLAHVKAAAPEAGARQLSCRVDELDEEPAPFLLKRGFTVEHEECLLELADLDGLPPVPDEPAAELRALPAGEAVAQFVRVYDESFGGMPWAQPYSEAEVAASLGAADDLLFAFANGMPVGVVWHEVLPDGRGRIEPIGVVAGQRGRGHGRRLLLAALRNLRQRGARVVEIGLWRQNAPAMNLYIGLGFKEVANWYYLACDVG